MGDGFFASSGSTSNLQQKRHVHKFAKGPTPNLNVLRRMFYAKFRPVHFMLKNDLEMGPYLYDQYFRVILCSPVFEGMTPAQMYQMVDQELDKIKLKGRVRVLCRPPS